MTTIRRADTLPPAFRRLLSGALDAVSLCGTCAWLVEGQASAEVDPAPAVSPELSYTLTSAGGGVYAFGHAQFYGSLPAEHVTPAKPIVGIATTADELGYWLVAADGGIFAFGDAGFYGAADPTTAQPGTSSQGSGIGPNTGFFCDAQGSYFTSDADVGQARTTVADIQSTADGRGYYLFGSDGGIFAYGDAQYQGPTGSASTLRARPSLWTARPWVSPSEPRLRGLHISVPRYGK